MHWCLTSFLQCFFVQWNGFARYDFFFMTYEAFINIHEIFLRKTIDSFDFCNE